MPYFNKVILMGNLTRDPELRVTQSGFTICKFSVAVSRTFTSQEGNVREETSFIDIDSFGRQAEVIAKFFVKGKPILVEGRLKQEQWETAAAEKRTRLLVVLERFEFVGSRNDNMAAQSTPNNYAEVSPPPVQASESFVQQEESASPAFSSEPEPVFSPSSDTEEDVPF